MTARVISELYYSNIITIISFYANFRVFDDSVFRFFLSFSFFFFFRTLVTRVSTAKITQLASLDLPSRDIDAYVLLDSRENIGIRVQV